MKKITLALAALAFFMTSCVAYVPASGPAPQGGLGNGGCPPGQAKKGRC